MKVDVAPLGKPAAVRLAMPEYPFCPAMFIVYVVDAPGGIGWLDGVAVIAKPAAALTTKVAEAEWLKEPLDAVIARG